MFPAGSKKKVIRKIVKKKPASSAPSTPAQSEGTLPYTTSFGSLQGNTDGADHYTGGYSQWREEQPDLWPSWQWPPYGWRPSQYQNAFWDENNPYHQYRYYNWDGSSPEPATPKGKQPELRSPDTQSTLLSRSTSSLSQEVQLATEQLQRCTTAQQLDFEQHVTEAGGPTQHPAVETPATAGGRDQREGPNVETPGGGGEEPRPEVPSGQNQVPPAGGNQEPPPHAQGEGNQPQNPNQPSAQPAGVGGTGEIPAESQHEVEMTADQLANVETRKKAAHARYMRYFRSIRSLILGVNAILVSYNS